MSEKEYLEKFLAESYKREIDQEENVARSLPFFATALAVLATVVGIVRSSIPNVELTCLSLAIWLLLALLGVAIFRVIYYLLVAVRVRTFEYVMREDRLLVYAGELRDYYLAQGLGGDNLDAAIVGDLRDNFVSQYASAVVNNRAINTGRAIARAQALTSLVAALFLAFVVLVVVLAHDGSKGDHDVDRSGQKAGRGSETAILPQFGRDSDLKTEPPTNGNGQEGRVDIERSVPREVQGEDKSMTGEKGNSGTSSGSSSGSSSGAGNSTSQTVKPSAPPPQRLQKDAGDGDLKK